jgi:hypothetical protein
VDSPEAMITALENAPRIVVPLVREVPSTVVRLRPQPSKWSAHEHACHLAEVHTLFFARLEQFMSEERPHITSYNPDEATEQGALLRLDLEESLERFTRERRSLVERLRVLSPDDWQRTADHDEYDHYSVFIMFRHLALHDMLHAYRIEELLLKKDWKDERKDEG